MQFDSEEQLVDTALSTTFIQDLVNGNPATIIKEPTGLFGRPDIAVGTIIESENGPQLHTFAFEMKLSNWKRALIQAFRYRAFAYKAYVVLDAKYIHRALRNKEKFEKGNIGLVSIHADGTVDIYLHPKPLKPYSSQLQATFSRMLKIELESATTKC